MYLDCYLKNDGIVYEISSSHGIRLASMHYQRSKCREAAMPFLFPVLKIMQRLGIKVMIHLRAELSDKEKNRVHTTFPYVPRFTSIYNFHKNFESENHLQLYECYEEAEKLGKILLSKDINCDGRWHMGQGDKGQVFVCCRWRDGQNHVIVMNEKIFFSDMGYDEISQAENENRLLGFGDENMKDVEIFAEAYPHTLLDVYVKRGGKKIFSFLTSRQMNHAFELLGKAGLSILADHLEMYKGLFLKGKNPQQIFGLPLKCLRQFNNENDRMLCTLENRAMLRWAYRQAPEIFQNSISALTELWIRYCFELYRTSERSCGSWIFTYPLGKTVKYLAFRERQGEDIYCIFVHFQSYISYSEEIGDYLLGKYPKNLEKALEMCIQYLNSQCKIKEKRFRHVVDNIQYQNYMEDIQEEDYCVKSPMDGQNMILAGKALHNCLEDYIVKIAKGTSVIGLLYEKSGENRKLIGAIEIRGNMLWQAKGNCNTLLNQTEQSYVRRYAGRKGLIRKYCRDLKN